MIVQNKFTGAIESDVEERGPLADRLLFWLLKHPYQRLSDLAFIFQVNASTVFRQLQRLLQQALVETISSASAASRRPDVVYYLTMAGIERVADLIGGADPGKLARMWKANEAELLRLLPRFSNYLLLQDAVLKLIADAPRQLASAGGYPAAIRWHWQHDYLHDFERKKKRQTFRADGAVVFRRRPLRQGMVTKDEETWYCLFWFVDSGLHGSEDLRLMRTRLERLLLWRESSERWSFYKTFPPLLVVAPTTHQRDLWIYCAQEAAAHLRVAPLKGACAIPTDDSPWRFLWQRLDGSGVATLHALATPLTPQAIPPGLLAPKQVEAPVRKRRRNKEEATVIGKFEARAKRQETEKSDRTSMVEISLLSLRLMYRHMDLLQHISALPLIAPEELAALVQKEKATVRRYLTDLYHSHCLKTLETARGKRLILTETGLRLIAAMSGVHLTHLAERNASTECWQQRGVRQALQTIAHTAGIYGFLAQIQTQARTIDQELLWWETTRSFRRYHLQGAWHNVMPDALFEYQAKDVRVEAWLEWDTGSMHQKSLVTKFTSYANYVRSQQYRHEHVSPPRLLIVAPHHGREQFLQRIVTSVLGSLPLTVWTTTEQLLQVQGPLAAIWRSLRSGQDLQIAARDLFYGS